MDLPPRIFHHMDEWKEMIGGEDDGWKKMVDDGLNIFLA